MSWKECVDAGIITKTVPDEERSKQILQMANLRLKHWNKKVADEFMALKAEAYYDIIKELIFAHLYKNGYNCTNHLCLIAYLKEKMKDFDFEIQKIDELRKVRNEINYRGIAIKKEYLERNELEFKYIIERLQKELNNGTSATLKTKEEDMPSIKPLIRTIPNFPKKGIMFRDITTLLKDPVGFKQVIGQFASRYRDSEIGLVVGVESRGFILGGALAFALGKGFVPVRKPGKLPGEKISHEYDLEYGKDKVELHTGAIQAGARVLMIDDLIATGGTMLAAIKLVEQLGGIVEECAFIIDLPDIGGSRKLREKGYHVFSLCEFEGE